MADRRTRCAQAAHLCSMVHGPVGFDDAARRFLRAGTAAGQRTLSLDREQAEAFYADRLHSDPHGLVAEFEAMALRAVADGATGLCLAVDATGVVGTVDDRRAFARLEHLADRMIRANGRITGMCCYDVDVLGDEVVAELAVLHEATVPDDTRFHLRAAPGCCELRLDGQLDLGTRELLERALIAAAPKGAHAVHVDVSGLEFIDVGSLRALDDAASSFGTEFVLAGAAPIVRRVVGVGGFERVRIEGP